MYQAAESEELGLGGVEAELPPSRPPSSPLGQGEDKEDEESGVSPPTDEERVLKEEIEKSAMTQSQQQLFNMIQYCD
ncbi:hypothetical protein MRB53_018901 [Persea americana]|uniref:Uncharacterized protein n=1 Tax=Persea americana TaxID=3435 RepID=A0ACC2M8U4_PERAE|nr:hypothetical protein MRB53_018901 [Persea americana]